MTDDQRTGDVHIDATFSGTNEGNQAAGIDIHQDLRRIEIGAGPTPEEVQALRDDFTALRDSIEQTAPEDVRERAIERVDELESATITDEPDVSVMVAAKRWLLEHVPGIAGAVTGVLIHPTVGKIVEAAGERIAREYREKFPAPPATAPEPG